MPRQFTPDDVARLEQLAQRPAAELRGLPAEQRQELEEFFAWQAEQEHALAEQQAAAAQRAELEALEQAQNAPLADLNPDAQREAILRLARAEFAQIGAERRDVRDLRTRQSRFHWLATVFVVILAAIGAVTFFVTMDSVNRRLANVEAATGRLLTPSSFDCRNADIKQLASGTLRLENCTPVLAAEAAPAPPANPQ